MLPRHSFDYNALPVHSSFRRTLTPLKGSGRNQHHRGVSFAEDLENQQHHEQQQQQHQHHQQQQSSSSSCFGEFFSSENEIGLSSNSILNDTFKRKNSFNNNNHKKSSTTSSSNKKKRRNSDVTFAPLEDFGNNNDDVVRINQDGLCGGDNNNNNNNHHQQKFSPSALLSSSSSGSFPLSRQQTMHCRTEEDEVLMMEKEASRAPVKKRGRTPYVSMATALDLDEFNNSNTCEDEDDNNRHHHDLFASTIKTSSSKRSSSSATTAAEKKSKSSSSKNKQQQKRIKSLEEENEALWCALETTMSHVEPVTRAQILCELPDTLQQSELFTKISTRSLKVPQSRQGCGGAENTDGLDLFDENHQQQNDDNYDDDPGWGKPEEEHDESNKESSSSRNINGSFPVQSWENPAPISATATTCCTPGFEEKYQNTQTNSIGKTRKNTNSINNKSIMKTTRGRSKNLLAGGGGTSPAFADNDKSPEAKLSRMMLEQSSSKQQQQNKNDTSSRASLFDVIQPIDSVLAQEQKPLKRKLSLGGSSATATSQEEKLHFTTAEPLSSRHSVPHAQPSDLFLFNNNENGEMTVNEFSPARDRGVRVEDDDSLYDFSSHNNHQTTSTMLMMSPTQQQQHQQPLSLQPKTPARNFDPVSESRHDPSSVYCASSAKKKINEQQQENTSDCHQKSEVTSTTGKTGKGSGTTPPTTKGRSFGNRRALAALNNQI